MLWLFEWQIFWFGYNPMDSIEKLACSWKPFEWPGKRLFQILLQFRFSKTSWKVLSSIYWFKVNNGNTRIMCLIRSKITIKKIERRYDNELVLVSLLLPLNILHTLLWRFHCWLLTPKWRVGCFLIFVTKCEDKKFSMLSWLRLRVKWLSYGIS